MAIVSVSATAKDAAVEQTPLVNRNKSPLSETDGRVGDPLLFETGAWISNREQLRRYFLEDRRDPLRR